jgi:acyl-coenzyme A synthetase/AMP-(fatty) acid ligase
VLLVLTIQGSIWVNFAVPALQGQTVFFIAYLIVSAIQMGATIDYAIVISNRYLQLKKEMQLKDAMIETLNQSFPTIFTSGSTGVPKGVIVNHRSTIDFIDCFTETFGITNEDVIGNQAPFDFDVSVKDIYSSLKTGATLQLIPKMCFSFPTKLLDFLDDRKVTTIIWAVSALCIVTTLNGFEYKRPSSLNKIMFSGEVMPIKHLNAWRVQYPDAMFVNLYGPTEITCNCTYYIIDREFGLDEKLPMGKPFANERVFLLDDEDKLVDAERPGELGEICVSGTAVTLGYLRNPEKTAAAFVQNPLNDRYLETIYRTGDLGYYSEDGELFFSSRKDFQIKHMGHRIELGEIETYMNGIEGLLRSCCIFDTDENKILGFFETESTSELDRKGVTHALKDKVPQWMIPNVLIKVDSMPLTKNGKIDRKELMKIYKEQEA